MMLRSFEVKRYRAGAVERVVDTLAAEEPLAIHVRHWRKESQQSESLAVTMRSPGADKELAVGLLLTEGVIAGDSDVVDVHALGQEPNNEVMVELARNVDFNAWRARRSGFVSSSCGVCGKASMEQIEQVTPAAVDSNWQVTPEFIGGLPELLAAHQATFHETGGVHAAALVSLDGALVSLFEDIGRHNALDKVIGKAVLSRRLPLSEHVVFMSSRGSFELVQKAAMAGVQMLACVGGPSSLAVETARKLGMTLIGFVRGERLNVYSGDWRVKFAPLS